MLKDKVVVRDQFEISGGNQRRIYPPIEKEIVQVRGFFSMVARERGKIVPRSRREGKNVWTLTGREYLARLMSYSAYGTPDTPNRNDRIRYIGFGTGTTPEVSTVASLVTPMEYNLASDFLAELAIPTFPFQTASSFGTSVRYAREVAEDELSVSGTVSITEVGLFTDGSPTSSFTPLTRDITLAQAANQAPVAYKTFEPVTKTQNYVLQATWEIAF